MSKPKALYILGESPYDLIYGESERRDLDELLDIYAPRQDSDIAEASPGLLHECEVILSGWGPPKIDAAFLQKAPNLKAVFYGAGSVKGLVSDEFWKAGILLSSAWGANAIPVAEYTLSQIIFSLKRGWAHIFDTRDRKAYPRKMPVPGAYGSVVGLVSLGMIGRRVAELLQILEVDLIAYDPYVGEADAQQLGVRPVSLEELFATSDVVSLHTPWLPATENLITGELLASMKQDATFINTARGAVVNQEEMIRVLQERTDLYAVLDVVYPEPVEDGSPLTVLPNVVLTPHIAGSMDRECNRMGRFMVEELQRWLRGEPLQWQVTREKFQIMA